MHGGQVGLTMYLREIQKRLKRKINAPVVEEETPEVDKPPKEG